MQAKSFLAVPRPCLSVSVRVGVLAALLAFAVPADAPAESAPRRARIEPSLAQLAPGQNQAFNVILTPELSDGKDVAALEKAQARVPAPIVWTVNGIPGGNETLGTLTAEGVYHAPATPPVPREIHIGAEVPEAKNRWLFSTVVLGGAPLRYRSCGGWTEALDKPNGRTEHFVYPHGIAFDQDRNLLIADERGHRVYRFTKDGHCLGMLGTESQFFEPKIVISDAAGRIYVSDMHPSRPRIQVFEANGQFLKAFGGVGEEGLGRPHGMGVDAQRRLFVVDVDRLRVNAFDENGTLLFGWGTPGVAPGQFNAPHGLVLDPSGDVFVNNYFGPLQKFGPDGEFVTAFCQPEPPRGPIYFHNIAGDRWGNVYTSLRCNGGYQGAYQADGSLISLAKYNNNGTLLAAWPLSGKRSETSVAIDRDDKVYALFVSETEMGVEVFEAD